MQFVWPCKLLGLEVQDGIKSWRQLCSPPTPIFPGKAQLLLQVWSKRDSKGKAFNLPVPAWKAASQRYKPADERQVSYQGSEGI